MKYIKLDDGVLRLMKVVIDHGFTNKDCCAKTISRNFDVNYKLLVVSFKEKYGYGIYERINELRLDKVKQLLVTTKLPITEIASQLGFSTYNHFLRIFKQKIILPRKVIEQSILKGINQIFL